MVPVYHPSAELAELSSSRYQSTTHQPSWQSYHPHGTSIPPISRAGRVIILMVPVYHPSAELGELSSSWYQSTTHQPSWESYHPHGTSLTSSTRAAKLRVIILMVPVYHTSAELGKLSSSWYQSTTHQTELGELSSSWYQSYMKASFSSSHMLCQPVHWQILNKIVHHSVPN